MDWKIFATVFGTVFLAELGDKTQIAAMLFASKSPQALITVFAAASLALMLSSAIAVFAGAAIYQYIKPEWLSYIAGGGFVVIGLWLIAQAAMG